MKKLAAIILTGVMCLTSVSAFADNEVKVYINSQELATDVPAQIINDRTMVPMRAIFEALHAQVMWIPAPAETIQATKNSLMIMMKIGSPSMFVTNAKDRNDTVTLDVPPQIVNDRTLVPVRAVSEALNCKVEWDGDTRSVYITN